MDEIYTLADSSSESVAIVVVTGIQEKAAARMTPTITTTASTTKTDPAATSRESAGTESIHVGP